MLLYSQERKRALAESAKLVILLLNFFSQFFFDENFNISLNISD